MIPLKNQKPELPLFYCENFYDRPFPSTKELFQYLGYDRVNIHLSYLFTPSMTTLRTVHGLGVMEDILAQKGVAFFWDNVLSEKEADMVLDIVRSFRVNLYDKEGLVSN